MERSADGRLRTTEWEDIQYKHGNKVGKYQTHELEILTQKIGAQSENICLKAYDPHEEKFLDKLERGGYESLDKNTEEELAIANSDDDDDALITIRQRRLKELQMQMQRECYGVLRHISGEDYVSEITEASDKHWVVAGLIKPGHSDCEALLSVLRIVAQRNRTIKFVSIVSTDAISTFPDQHLPCVLLYKDKELKQQITGLSAWKCKGQLNVNTVERVLHEYGVMTCEDIVQKEDV